MGRVSSILDAGRPIEHRVRRRRG